ncbi:hypothetical protein M431DRAFT_491299 [Trichoderma harzianum CBS 226.95]|uniref:Uncharacterized protein n=1 Tax=Trichoderma harzianum CBS 226.95 TaxID=983964 RepID=A0A2T4ARH8_TRIHA|nr:hypothetical protein M431DRAFT_491299 [Trichoderma harzianum CBS 226.95]PTB59685.1 hypothetical protein M431DRAFT_491299 [Trichoderma harzianum CBS 226.95]
MERTAWLFRRRHASWQRIGIAPSKFGAAAATAGHSAYQPPFWGRDEPDTRGVSRPGGLGHSVEGEFDRLAVGIRDVHSPLRGSALSSAFLQPSKNLATSDMCAGPAYSYQYYAFSPSKGHEPPARSAHSPVSQQIGTMSCLVCIMGYNTSIALCCE